MNILFLCVANSARSQLAEALCCDLFPTFTVKSAGSKPSQVNPLTVQVLEEHGIATDRLVSKGIEHLPEAFVRKLDYVVTLCAEEVCPFLPSQAVRLHWPFPDPATEAIPKEEQLERFREVRDDIELKLMRTFGNLASRQRHDPTE